MREGAHHAKSLPPPDATPGSLLELIQLANYHGINWHGTSSRHTAARALCCAAAETHREQLDRARAREGLRSFVQNCDAPWDGLWRQVAPVIGAEVVTTMNKPSSREKKGQRVRALATPDRS